MLHITPANSRGLFLKLLTARSHSPLEERERSRLILARTRLVALILALLMIGWIPLDLLLMPWGSAGYIVLARLFSGLLLVRLALWKPDAGSLLQARLAISALLALSILFFVYSNMELRGFAFLPETMFFISAYAHLIILISMLISLFPLTLLEGAVFASIMVISAGFVTVFNATPAYMMIAFGTLWLHLVITGLAVVAASSQLYFTISLVEHMTHDVMTGFLKRDYGLVLMDALFSVSERNHIPLSVLFVDLDNFKGVNDAYGHEAGDAVLKQAATRLQSILRRQDVKIRWGGEEFVILLPGMHMKDVKTTLERLGADALGPRPDGSPQLASVGVAEFTADPVSQSQELVKIADQRMYQAKKLGRNTVMLKDESYAFSSAKPAALCNDPGRNRAK